MLQKATSFLVTRTRYSAQFTLLTAAGGYNKVNLLETSQDVKPNAALRPFRRPHEFSSRLTKK